MRDIIFVSKSKLIQYYSHSYCHFIASYEAGIGKRFMMLLTHLLRVTDVEFNIKPIMDSTQ